MLHTWLSHLRARRPSTIRRPANRVRSRLQMDLLEDRTVPALLDLTAVPSGSLNGGTFELIAQQPAGSGVIDSFVRLHDIGPDDTNTPEGHNSSGRNQGSPKLNFDENSSPVFTHNIQLQDIPQITVGKTTYREFRLDVNEPNNSSAVPVSLNKVKIFSSKTPDLLASPTNLSTLGTLRWDMDGGTPAANALSGPDTFDTNPPPASVGNWVKLNDVNHGSGQADMRLLVPESAFAGVSKTDYIYFYSRFGDTQAMTGGYEEWYLGAPAKEVPVNVVTEIFRGTHGAGETPVLSPFQVPLASVVHDHATVTDLSGNLVTVGSVTFSFWNNIDCQGDPLWTDTDSNGADGWQSKATDMLHSGQYSFAARYDGVAGKFSPGTSDCEPLTVTPLAVPLVTNIHDAAHKVVGYAGFDGHVKLASIVHDSAFFVPGPQVSPTSVPSGKPTPFTPGFIPTGTVKYTFTGPAGAFTQTVTINADGTIPESQSTIQLPAGKYNFTAEFISTNKDFVSGKAADEPLTVDKANVDVRTEVHNSAHVDITGKIVVVGTTIHDAAFVTPVGGPYPFAVTGKVTYTFFNTDDCTGTPAGTWTVTIGAGGVVPESPAITPPAGYHSYMAVYLGDSNFNGDEGECEPIYVSNLARTQGYWKTHGPDSPGGQENAWPVSSISIGGVSYTAAEAIAIMNASTEGNAISSLFQQLVAYKLNVLNNVIPTAQEVAAAALADQLIAQATGGAKLQVVSGNTLNFVVAPSSALGQQMIDAMGILTDFNESGI